MSKQSIHTYEVEFKDNWIARVRNVLHVEQIVEDGKLLIYFYNTEMTPKVFDSQRVKQFYVIDIA